MTALSLDHVAIPIIDARASHRFYSEVLGFELVDALSGDDWDGKPWLMMIFGVPDGRQLALVAFRGAKPREQEGDERHYAFAVATEEERVEWRARLRANDVEVREEHHGTQRSLYFSDPNGITLEITSPPTPKVAKPNAEAKDIVWEWIEAGA